MEEDIELPRNWTCIAEESGAAVLEYTGSHENVAVDSVVLTMASYGYSLSRVGFAGKKLMFEST